MTRQRQRQGAESLYNDEYEALLKGKAIVVQGYAAFNALRTLCYNRGGFKISRRRLLKSEPFGKEKYELRRTDTIGSNL